MSNIIRIKRGTTGGVVPTGLTFGELAVNITDKKLFVGGITGNTIELLASNGGGGGGTAAAAGETGNIQFKYGSGLSASSGFSLSPVDPTYQTGFSALPSQPSYTDTLKLVAPTGQSGDVYEVSPIGLAFHRHLRGGFDNTGGSVIEAVGSIYEDDGDGLKVRGNNLILRSSGEGETGYKGHIRIFDAYDTLAYEVSNDDQAALYHQFFGNFAVQGNFAFAAGYTATFGGNVFAPNIVNSVNGITGAVSITSGSNITLTQSGKLITIAAAAASASAPPLASATLTGAASFNPIYFSISPTGHVGLASAYQVTGDTVVTNSGLSSVRSGNTVTITNIGVTAFNGLTGSVSMTGDGGAVYGIGNNTIAARVATTSVTGAASFNPVYFTTGITGHVSLAAGYQVTGDTVSAGTGIGTVRNGSQVTISNAGVLSFNGLTGQATTLTGDDGAIRGVGNNAITARVSSASLTGVASFSTYDFVVGTTGHVGLTGMVARMDITNTFTAVQSFPNGISGAWLSIGAGATFNGRATFAQGLSSSSLWVGGGATFTGAVSISGGTAWHANNDGKGSGLDADLLRGVNGDRYLEEMQSGLLYGGVLSINGTTGFNVSAGAGIVVTVNASLTGYPAPTLTTVTWNSFTGQAVTGLTSGDFTFVRIDSSGNLQQSTSDFTQSQYLNSVVLGNLVHPNRSTLDRVHSHPIVAYASNAQYETFIRYFGPLKVSGYAMSGYGTTGQVQVSSGIAFALGANMENDPNNPSLVTDSANTPLSTFYYLYRNADGSYKTDPATSTVVNFGKYDDGSGTLANVSANRWSIQRVYKIPSTSVVYVYYGRDTYVTDTAAIAAILSESFDEADITRYNGVFLGWLIVRGHGTDVGNTSDCRIIPGGFFRNTTGGGGAATVANLDDLGDVVITTPSNNQILRYDSTQSLWVNSPVSNVAVASFNGLTGNVLGVSSFNGLTAAVTLTGDGGAIRGVGNNTIGARLSSSSLTGVASFSTNDFVVGTTGHVGLTGTIARTNAAQTFSGVQTFSNGITTASLWVGGGGATFNASLAFQGTNAKTIISKQAPLTIMGITSGPIVGGYNAVVLGVGVSDPLQLYSTTGVVDVLSGFADTAIPFTTSIRLNTGGGEFGESPATVTIQPSTYFTANRTINIPDDSGTLALTGANTFSGLQTMNAGLTARNLWVGGGGATFASNASFASTTNHTGLATFTGGLTSSSLWVGGGATFASAVQFIGNISAPNIVNSVNGLTAAVSITSGSNVTLTQSGNLITIAAAAASSSAPPLATSSLTGVASFGINDFVVSVTGSVSLTGTVARTNAAQTFTGLQTFNTGLSATSLWVGSGGATFSGPVQIPLNTTPAFKIGNHGTRNLVMESIDGVAIIRQTGNAAGSIQIIQDSGGPLTLGGGANNTNVSVTDTAQTIYVNSLGNVFIGDTDVAANGTVINVSDSIGTIDIYTPNGSVNIGSPVTANLLTVNSTTANFANLTITGATATINNFTATARSRFLGGLTSSNMFVGGGGATFASAVSFLGNISAPNIVNTVNGLTAAVSITSGSNITLTQTGSLITIASTAGGGFTRSIISFTGATSAGSASSTDYVYICGSTGSIDLTMPTAVSNTNRYTVKQNSTGTLTIITTSSQTIDGVTGFALNRQYQAVDLISDNSNWIVV